MTALHAASLSPFPVPGEGGEARPDGTRLDYRTACHPWGVKRKAGDMTPFRVVDGPDRFARATCKACLR